MQQKFSGTAEKQIRRDIRLAIYIRDEFTCQLCEKSLRKAKPEQLSILQLGKEWGSGPENLFTACRSCASGFYSYRSRFSVEEFQLIRETISTPIDLGLANKILEGRSLKWPNPWNPDYVKLDPALKSPKTPSPEEKVNRLLKVIDEMKLK